MVAHYSPRVQTVYRSGCGRGNSWQPRSHSKGKRILARGKVTAGGPTEAERTVHNQVLQDWTNMLQLTGMAYHCSFRRVYLSLRILTYELYVQWDDPLSGGIVMSCRLKGGLTDIRAGLGSWRPLLVPVGARDLPGRDGCSPETHSSPPPRRARGCWETASARNRAVKKGCHGARLGRLRRGPPCLAAAAKLWQYGPHLLNPRATDERTASSL